LEIQDKFSHVSEFGHKYPQGFLICAFITHPSDRVQQFTGTTSVIDLGIKNFGDLKLRFIVYHDSRQGGLNLIRDQVWVGGFQHRYMEHWVYGSEAVREL